MRLTHRFTIVLTCAILTVLVVKSIIRVQDEVALFEEDIANDNRLMGRALADAASRVWRNVGEAEALDMIKNADARQYARSSGVAIRWVWLDAPPGHEHAAGVPSSPALTQLRERDPVDVRWKAPDESDETMYTYALVAAPGHRRIAIEVRESLAAESRYLRHTITQEALATGTLVLICGLLTHVLGVLFVRRPTRQLVDHARRIGEGDLSSRLDLRSRDEFGALSQEMNAMGQRLEAARGRIAAETAAKLAAVEQMRHADRLATVGKLAAGIAHEVGTPLNVITGHAQLITDEYMAGTPPHDNAVVIAEQAHRVAAIIRQLLDFARPNPPKKVGHDLAAVAGQVATLLGSLAQKRDITIELAGSPQLAVRSRVDAAQLQQVIMNLVVNAFHATSKRGTITIGVARRHIVPPADRGGHAGDYACVSVEDRGTGISVELLPRIFEPFFTTKDVGDGTGLGLAVAYGIVKEHGGWIDVASEVGVGTCFSVYLPLEEAA